MTMVTFLGIGNASAIAVTVRVIMVAEPTNKLTTKRYTGKYFFKKRIKKSILPTSLSGYAALIGITLVPLLSGLFG